MANPLIRLGASKAVKLVKKIKKAKARANSTNNINTGPIDRAIKRTKKIIDRYEGAIDNYTLGGNPGTKLNVGAPNRLHRGLQKAKALKNNLGFKRLHKKMGIK
jgi:hypothetical protein|tara:strand:- start:1451 stop:1762 length:312 start_codon:yes stop_codon:yes gene_type:complete